MTLYHGRDDLAFAVHVFAVDMVALDLFDLLEHHLLGSLSSDTAEILRRQLDHHALADLDIRANAARGLEIDLEALVVDFVDHLLFSVHQRIAGLGIDFHVDLDRRRVLAEVALVCRFQRFFDDVLYRVTRNSTLRRDLRDGCVEIAFHIPFGRSKRKVGDTHFPFRPFPSTYILPSRTHHRNRDGAKMG